MNAIDLEWKITNTDPNTGRRYNVYHQATHTAQDDAIARCREANSSLLVIDDEPELNYVLNMPTGIDTR